MFKSVKVVVACTAPNGWSAMYPCTVQLTEAQYAGDEHYEMAQKMAEAEGYSYPFVSFDGKEFDSILQTLPFMGYSVATPTESLEFKLALERAIAEVNKLASDASVHPHGFQIDENLCDWNELPTSNVADVIVEYGCTFGACESKEYTAAVRALCDAITEHFSVK